MNTDFYYTSPKAPFNDIEASTQDNFYEIEDGQKEYEELMFENRWLKDQLHRKYNLLNQESVDFAKQADRKFGQNISNDDIYLHELAKRNKFLEEKNQELKRQKINQTQEITRVESSENWKNKFRCCPGKCYHQKYLQLLRVKSPLL